MIDGMDANIDPALALALLAIPPRALRAVLVMAANAGHNGTVTMNARQLAEGLSTPDDPVSVDTAYRALHAVDARYGGTGHIKHIGTNPRDNRYQVLPFPEVGANNYVREDMFCINADSRTVAESGTAAESRTVASESRTGAAKNTSESAIIRNDAETLRKSATIRPPHPHGKTNTTTTSADFAPRGRRDDRGGSAGRGGGGGGGGDICNDEKGHGERVQALKAAGVNNAKTRRELAERYTALEIAAAVALARAYGGSGGAIKYELEEGNATQAVKERDAAKDNSAKLAAARVVLEKAQATTGEVMPDFDPQAHAARCNATTSATLAEAFGRALQWEHRAALALDRRGINIATVTDAANAATDEGRAFVLEAVTHKLIRAGVARELDRISAPAPRVVPEAAP